MGIVFFIKYIYFFGGMDFVFFYWKFLFLLVERDNFMEFGFWIFEMFIFILFIYKFVVRIIVKLIVFVIVVSVIN